MSIGLKKPEAYKIDITGQKFGKLTAIKFAGRNKRNRPCWTLKCDCGRMITAVIYDILSGNTKTCGFSTCKNRFVDLTGKSFAFLTVIKFVRFNKNHASTWLCKCVCGKEKILMGYLLKNGQTKSCGCKTDEMMSLKHQKPLIDVIAKQAYYSHKRGAKVRNIKTYLTEKQYKKIALLPCVYCGKISIRKTSRKFSRSMPFNSVDRRDNEPYYKLSNSQPVCFTCQREKKDSIHEEFINHSLLKANFIKKNLKKLKKMGKTVPKYKE